MPKAILIFGPTCAGKSTIGQILKKEFVIPYYSFGDLKRLEIDNNTKLGKNIAAKITLQEAIDPEQGMQLIMNRYQNEEYISICGYPISWPEMSNFQEIFTVTTIINLKASPRLIRRRYFRRGVCPKCKYPGTLGSTCPIHYIALVKRDDVTEEELKIRLKLYKNRIYPFFSDLSKSGVFNIIEYSAGKKQAGQIIAKIKDVIGEHNAKTKTNHTSH